MWQFDVRHVLSDLSHLPPESDSWSSALHPLIRLGAAFLLKPENTGSHS